MNILRSSLKALGYLLALLVLLAAGLYAWLVAANWTDDPLSPAAQQALQYTPPTDAQLQNNGFLILYGLDAPNQANDQDAVAPAIALGRQRLTRELERHAWVRANPLATEGMPPGIDGGAQRGSDPLWTSMRRAKTQADCFTAYLQQRTTIESLQTQHQPLLQRVLAAAHSPQFSNLAPNYLHVSMPPYTWLMRAQDLGLASAALQWMDGEPEKALTTVTQLVQLRTQLAQSSNSLVTSMVALAMQYRELRWLSNAIHHTSANTPAAATQTIERLLQVPVPHLGSALNGEKQFIAEVYASTKDMGYPLFIDEPFQAPPWWEPLWSRVTNAGFLHAETLNISIQYIDQMQDISQLPIQAQAPAIAQYLAQFEALPSTCSAPWRRMRNIAGSCIAAISAPIYPNYLQRVSDLDGYRRLVLLQSQAQRQALAGAIAATDMPAWLETSPSALRNPYTMQPMQWDPASNSLVFEGKERQNQHPDGSRTYRVPLLLNQP